MQCIFVHLPDSAADFNHFRTQLKFTIATDSHLHKRLSPITKFSHLHNPPPLTTTFSPIPLHLHHSTSLEYISRWPQRKALLPRLALKLLPSQLLLLRRRPTAVMVTTTGYDFRSTVSNLTKAHKFRWSVENERKLLLLCARFDLGTTDFKEIAKGMPGIVCVPHFRLTPNGLSSHQ